MNIVIAPDSYKGSLTSSDASSIMKKAVMEIYPDAFVLLKPMADGGEGTLESLVTATSAVTVTTKCTGPLGNQISTTYGIIDGKTAVIEYAKIAGLFQVAKAKRNPDLTTSYGLGEVILHALDKGCTAFIVGLGGSATNDGGLGMLQALGMKSIDASNRHTGPYGKDLLHIKEVDVTGLDKRLSKVRINVACDVDNPLCGNRGASIVYGPQKGATSEQVKKYDEALDFYSNLIESKINKSVKGTPGSGAAGGLGFAFLVLGAELVSGAELVGNTMDLETAIRNADFVLTGEGQSDEQTLYGKAPGYVATLARKYNVPAVLISGSLKENSDVLRESFSGCFSIINKPITLEESMEKADQYLYEQTKQIFHLISSIRK
ncbi:glycerate kinase [Oceanobacillus saliphilus]|uniref:glycerate kinase n=1 Tax=Oceanobacillus saliphilus TaxID=2925834 RepID=UPI00201D5800|nr:glycerate kinase [Oceanobacillus saliphilus]